MSKITAKTAEKIEMLNIMAKSMGKDLTFNQLIVADGRTALTETPKARIIVGNKVRVEVSSKDSTPEVIERTKAKLDELGIKYVYTVSGGKYAWHRFKTVIVDDYNFDMTTARFILDKFELVDGIF